MKTKKLMTLMAVGFLALTSTAFAEKVGNGGGAIVCGNADGSIQFASLLDLMEAEEGGLTIRRTNESKEAQLDRAINKLALIDPVSAFEMRKVLHDLKKESIPEGKELYPPTDTGLKFLTKRKNCSARGLGNFDDKRNVLEVDSEIETAMSQTDQAAFDFHETYYKAQRLSQFSPEDSLSARKVTGAVFAQESFQITPVTQGLERAQYLCETREAMGGYVVGQPKLSPVVSSIFYIIPAEDRKVHLQFTQIAGKALIEQTLVTLDPLHLKNESFGDTQNFPANNEDTVARFRNGLALKHVKKGDQDSAYGYQPMAVQSEFSQPLVATFKFNDIQNRCGFGKMNCSHFLKWTKPSIIENYEVSLGFYAPGMRHAKATGIVSCRKL